MGEKIKVLRLTDIKREDKAICSQQLDEVLDLIEFHRLTEKLKNRCVLDGNIFYIDYEKIDELVLDKKIDKLLNAGIEIIEIEKEKFKVMGGYIEEEDNKKKYKTLELTDVKVKKEQVYSKQLDKFLELAYPECPNLHDLLRDALLNIDNTYLKNINIEDVLSEKEIEELLSMGAKLKVLSN